MGKKKKVILPPLLPPEVGEDEIEVSDEDLEFVRENRDYAGFLSSLDTKSITRHVVRIADQKEEDIEALYEERSRRASLKKQAAEDGLQVDRVDALPVKTLDGKLYYKTALKVSKSEDASKEYESATEDKDEGKDKSLVKLTKAERRQKLKKTKKEAKKQAKELPKEDTVEGKLQPGVLAELKEYITAEETLTQKKRKLAEIGMLLLEDPESNIKSLKELLQLCDDEDHDVLKLGLLSLLAVFKDIIPSYRIRLPSEKELQMTVSKPVQKMRFYESTLLRSYKAYLQKLINLKKQPSFRHVAVRCMCTLLEAVPHFNFRESLLVSVVKSIGSSDDVIRKLCCKAIKSIFTNEGKHGGEATVEAVQLIAAHVKSHNCQLHPDCVEVFLSLSFDEDLGLKKREKTKPQKKKRGRNFENSSQVQENDRKRSRKELAAKARDEVNADFKEFNPDSEERRRMQTEILSAVFQTYFRILKHSMEPDIAKSKINTNVVFGGFGRHPLLAPCLKGLGKFSHLIDLDFMSDLMGALEKLAGLSVNQDDHPPENSLTVSERLQCCIVAFKVMRNNLDALNVDLQNFFVQLYNLLLEYRPDRDEGEVLAEALKIMLCEGRQHDMQRAAAFIKRLATISLCFGSAEAMAALVTLKQLLQKNPKCRNLLENDVGGGSISGSVAKYQPDASDPHLCGALSSVLWELSLLSKHYHPAVSSMATSISSMGTGHETIPLSIHSPQHAFADLSIERQLLSTNISSAPLNCKRKRGNRPSNLNKIEDMQTFIDESELKKRFGDHFRVLRDFSENRRLRGELNHTLSSINLYKEYKQQKRKQKDSKATQRKKGTKVL
ncbi:hypothetical protein QJS10_CPB11g01552 [Acorus calamus]|uniref:Nucleolar complex protein 3 homolog n=1 Tax=Acorus calamus TaxID=4465 RepID=A0AAV9DW68_ACOCL|nr:hypothetical protein QJS10_CPB11g01552 [Acorus calamus]